MKVDINKTYRTKSGLPVVIYAIYEGQTYAVHGAYQDEDSVWYPGMWRLNGCLSSPDDPCRYDLVEVRPPHVVWINEYENEVGLVHSTKKEADECHGEPRIALHRVVLNEDTVWREGDDASV